MYFETDAVITAGIFGDIAAATVKAIDAEGNSRRDILVAFEFNLPDG